MAPYQIMSYGYETIYIYMNCCLIYKLLFHLLILQNELIFSEIDYMQKRVRNKSNLISILNVFIIIWLICIETFKQEVDLHNDNQLLRAKVKYTL